jgi:hypothetical protein
MHHGLTWHRRIHTYTHTILTHPQVQEWAQELEHTSQDKLKQSLLRRECDADGNEEVFLRVNFDPALVCLLREVKYFKLLNDYKTEAQKMIVIPESAMQIYAKAEIFRQQVRSPPRPVW